MRKLPIEQLLQKRLLHYLPSYTDSPGLNRSMPLAHLMREGRPSH